jgi:hypothetical protein
MNSLIRLNLLLLMTIAVFDPSDLLTHLKVPLFAGVWILVLVDMAISNSTKYRVPTNLYLYTLVFALLLPAFGMLIYVLRGGGMEGYDGFRYFKSYLFLTLCIPLAVKRIDPIRSLSIILSGLSFATVFLDIVTTLDSSLRVPLAFWGDAYTIFSLTDRSYGTLSYQSLYFHASPLLVVPIVYFCHQLLESTGRQRWLAGSFLLLNFCGMVLSGTRNNMIVAVMAPLMIIAWYRKTYARLIIIVLLIGIVVVGYSFGVVQAMFSSDDLGNAIKLGHLHDYGVLFADWRTLLFGQGFGASFFSTAWGTRVTLTELSYLELIRNYGLPVALVFYGLMLYPLRVLGNQQLTADHYLFLGYACYLYLCSGNPLFLSSTGMLVLAIVLFKTFCNSTKAARQFTIASRRFSPASHPAPYG